MQAFFGVTVLDGHCGLGDNRAGIDPGIYEMNRQPGDFNAVDERIKVQERQLLVRTLAEFAALPKTQTP